jgi:cold shock CspA family protein
MAKGRMLQGTVLHYDPERGVGEVQTERGETFPVHRNELRDEALRGLYTGDIVEFTGGRNRFGHKAALEVRRVGWDEAGDDDTPREWSF